MGKIRVRATFSNNQETTHKVQTSKDTTLEAFKHNVAQAFGWSQSANFGISLNKQVEICGDPESLLCDVGICSGDLVWIMQPPGSESTSASNMRHSPPENLVASTPQHSGGTVERNHAEQRIESSSASRMDTTSTCQVLLEDSEDTDIHPHEVHIPQSLKESLEALETQSLHSLVVAVGHAAFTDLGFVLRASKEPFPSYRGGIYVLQYDFKPDMLISNPQNAEATSTQPLSSSEIPVTTLRFIPMVDFLMTYVDVEGCDTLQGWTVQCSKHVIVQPNGGLLLKNWRKLWRECRDQLGISATVNTAAAVGCLPKYGLLSLPDETKELIAGKLDVRELLSLCQTCKDLRHIGSNDRIWKELYDREFAADGTRQSGFKQALKLKIRAGRKKSRRGTRISSTPNHNPFPMPAQPGLGIPGFVGGDLDRLPNFGVMPGTFFGGHTGGRLPPPFGTGSRGRGRRGFGQFGNFGF